MLKLVLQTVLPLFVPHGWPYDIYSFADVAPTLAESKGWLLGDRSLCAGLRGTTHFLSSATFRNGQQSAVAVDVTDLAMDALKIEGRSLAVLTWKYGRLILSLGCRPERCKALVTVSGYLIGSPQRCRSETAVTAGGEHYSGGTQYYFATERGVLGYDKYRNDFSGSSFGGLLHLNGPSTMPRSIAPRLHSTIRTMSPSRSTITAGD